MPSRVSSIIYHSFGFITLAGIGWFNIHRIIKTEMRHNRQTMSTMTHSRYYGAYKVSPTSEEKGYAVCGEREHPRHGCVVEYRE